MSGVVGKPGDGAQRPASSLSHDLKRVENQNSLTGFQKKPVPEESPPSEIQFFHSTPRSAVPRELVSGHRAGVGRRNHAEHCELPSRSRIHAASRLGQDLPRVSEVFAGTVRWGCERRYASQRLGTANRTRRAKPEAGSRTFGKRHFSRRSFSSRTCPRVPWLRASLV